MISKKLNLVSKTIEDELKFYYLVLLECSTTALSPKNIASAVKKIAKEENRSQELIIFGVEKEGQSL